MPVPVELLYEIIIEVLGDYLHAAFLSTEPISWDAVLSLSHASFAFRDITLQIASTAFGIERDESGSLKQSHVTPLRRMHNIHGQAINSPLDLFGGTFDLSSVQSPFLHAYMSVNFAVAFQGANSKMPNEAQKIRLAGGIKNYLDLGMARSANSVPGDMGVRVGMKIVQHAFFMESFSKLSVCTGDFDAWLDDAVTKMPHEEDLSTLDQILTLVEACEADLAKETLRTSLYDVPMPKLSRPALEGSRIVVTLRAISEITTGFGGKDRYEVQDRIQKLLTEWKPILYGTPAMLEV